MSEQFPVNPDVESVAKSIEEAETPAQRVRSDMMESNEAVVEPESAAGHDIERREALPAERQVEIVFEMALTILRRRRTMKGDDFSEEVNELITLLIEESPDFDKRGKALVEQACARVQPHLNGVQLEFLPHDALGRWDGKEIAITPELVVEIIRKERDVALLRAVRAHEEYHKENRHEEDFATGETAYGNIVVRIGGVEFTKTQLIEGINTIDTPLPPGEESPDYREYAKKILKAVKRSKEVDSLDEVRKAINKTKDLGKIEDKR